MPTTLNWLFLRGLCYEFAEPFNVGVSLAQNGGPSVISSWVMHIFVKLVWESVTKVLLLSLVHLVCKERGLFR